MEAKNFIRIFFLLSFSALLMLASCVKEGPMGLSGIDGVDGVDGSHGQDGSDGTASCVACHNKTTKETIVSQFSKSLHGEMPTKARSTNGNCAGCHSSEGFIESLNNVLVKPVTAVSNPSAMNCESCHTMHQTFDFENDGPDYALRTTKAVPMFQDHSVVIDMGTSNICVNCHQPRQAAPKADPNGNAYVADQRFGPHYGAQSVILEGLWGYHHPQGSTAIPAAKSAAHRKNASCTSCHMHDSTTGTAGGHSWEVGPEACKSCHTSITTKELIAASKASFNEDFNKLGQKLLEIGALRTNALGTGLEPNPQKTWPIGVTGALWNYRLLYQDHSGGIHNPAYAKALLKNSIEALN